MRLYWRIVLPFAIGLVLVIGAGTLIASTLLAGQADRGLESHLATVAQRMAEGGFALNRPLLERLKVAVGAEVLVAGPGGEVLASTLEGGEAGEAANLVARLAGRSGPDASTGSLQTVAVGGKAHKFLAVSIAAADAAPQTLAFFAPLAPIEAARASVARTLAVVSLGGLVLMFVWGHLITRGITRPLGHLVASTQAVASGDLSHRTTPPRIPELMLLANAFDHMVAKIRESEARLVRSERLAAVGQIAATVAHEVRNPLAAIRMMAQFLRRYHAEQTQAGQACGNIIEEIDRLEMLVKGLLETMPARPLQRQEVRLDRVVEEIADLTVGQLRHRRIALELRVESPLPPLQGDPQRLKQVVLNLILNAADAMPDGGPLSVVTRRAPETPAAAESIELLVLDAGNGLCGEAAERAFEPFFSTKPGGAGLGLAVCRRIVEEHQGQITVANRPEGGAVATVRLPLGAESHAVHAAVAGG